MLEIIQICKFPILFFFLILYFRCEPVKKKKDRFFLHYLLGLSHNTGCTPWCQFLSFFFFFFWCQFLMFPIYCSIPCSQPWILVWLLKERHQKRPVYHSCFLAFSSPLHSLVSCEVFCTFFFSVFPASFQHFYSSERLQVNGVINISLGFLDSVLVTEWNPIIVISLSALWFWKFFIMTVNLNCTLL